MSNSIELLSEKAKELIDSGQYLDVIEGIDSNEPWSTASLDQAESWFIANHQNCSDETKEAYKLFLGEGLRRQFGGK